MASHETEAARIFLEAVDHHEPHQWADYVQKAVAGDQALLERVEALFRLFGPTLGPFCRPVVRPRLAEKGKKLFVDW